MNRAHSKLKFFSFVIISFVIILVLFWLTAIGVDYISTINNFKSFVIFCIVLSLDQILLRIIYSSFYAISHLNKFFRTGKVIVRSSIILISIIFVYVRWILLRYVELDESELN